MCEFRSLLDWGAFHSLCGGLALSWRWVPSRVVKNCWDFGALFGGHLLFAVGFLATSLATAECSLFVGMRERQDGGLCQDDGSSGREF